MTLAIFDVDGTLFPFNTEKSLIKYLYKKNIIRLGEALKLFVIGQMMKHGYYREISFKFLQNMTSQELEELSEKYYSEILKEKIDSNMADEIKKYDNILLLSASPEIIIKKIANEIGAEYISSKLEIKDGEYTGKYEHWNFGERKLNALKDYLKNKRYEKLVFYSDSYSDMPVFEFVDVRIAVNPDKKLRKIATKRGWRIITHSHTYQALK